MQIKMKPGKPTEPGIYICARKNTSFYEVAHVFFTPWGSREVLMFSSLSGLVELDRLEDEAIFSERIELVIEE